MKKHPHEPNRDSPNRIERLTFENIAYSPIHNNRHHRALKPSKKILWTFVSYIFGKVLYSSLADLRHEAIYLTDYQISYIITSDSTMGWKLNNVDTNIVEPSIRVQQLGLAVHRGFLVLLWHPLCMPQQGVQGHRW